MVRFRSGSGVNKWEKCRQSANFESHQILGAANIPGLENIANLSQLPAVGSWVVGLPMLIRHGSGAPLRVVALVPEG